MVFNIECSLRNTSRGANSLLANIRSLSGSVAGIQLARIASSEAGRKLRTVNMQLFGSRVLMVLLIGCQLTVVLIDDTLKALPLAVWLDLLGACFSAIANGGAL